MSDVFLKDRITRSRQDILSHVRYSLGRSNLDIVRPMTLQCHTHRTAPPEISDFKSYYLCPVISPATSALKTQ